MTSPQALDGVRVLDLTHHIAGPFCTKLLADYGADVIKIERPGTGDPSRQEGPFFHDEPHPEGSALFLHLNTNKRSVCLNLATDEGRDIALRLAARSHIVVENFRPGTLDRLGLGYEALRSVRPDIVLVSISNFGQTGPYRDLPMSEITAYAMGGAMNATGHRDREPLKLGGNVVQYHAGANAAFAAMVAFWRVEAGGPGDHVDVAIYETQAGSRDRRTIYLTAYSYSGYTSYRSGSETRLAGGVRIAADGYVYLAGYGKRLPSFLRMIGREDLADDPRVSDAGAELDAAWVEEIENSYLIWARERPKAQIVAEAQEHGILAGAVNNIDDLFTNPQFVARPPWDVIDHPHTGPLHYPGGPFRMSATPRRTGGRAPLLGEHTRQVLQDELGMTESELTRLSEEGVI